MHRSSVVYSFRPVVRASPSQCCLQAALQCNVPFIKCTDTCSFTPHTSSEMPERKEGFSTSVLTNCSVDRLY